MPLARALARRVVVSLGALFVFLLVAYLAIEQAIPNDANSLFPVMTQAELDDYRSRLGLEEPPIVQFGIWLRGVITGDLGRTTFGAPVATRIGDALARTALLLVLGLTLAYVAGSWLGRRSGWQRRPGRGPVTVGAVLLGTAFPPFVAFVLTMLLRERTTALIDLRRQWVGDIRTVWTSVEVTQTQVAWGMVAALVVGGSLALLILRQRRAWPSLTLTGAIVFAAALWWLATDLEAQALDLLFAAAVPLIAFVLLSFGEFMLVAQAATSNAPSEDFVMAARARGLPERRVRDEHGGSAARLVMLSRLAVSIPYLMTGLVIIEQAVDWPGLGDFLFQALQGRDLPTIMSSLLVIGVLTVGVRAVLEVAAVALDPRLAAASRHTMRDVGAVARGAV